MKQRIKNAAQLFSFLAVIALIVTGCGGGGGGSTPAAVKASSKGVITGFGSVFVNGVKYESASSTVSMDGLSAAESDLQLGMVVTVSGMLDPSGATGTAGTITFTDNLEGPVSALYSGASKTFAVMGQIVKVDGSTMYQNVNDASLLAMNDMVEVSGFPDANGVILATRIEKKATVFSAGTTTVELKGLVSGLTGSAFAINALSIDASGVSAPAGLANGSFVEVRGTLAAAAGPMTATFLELEPQFSAGENEHVEVEGIVTDYVSLSSFKVNGVPVNGSALGSVAIANNMMIEVEGSMVGGVLIAGKGEIEFESTVLLEGDVSAVGGSSLTVLGKTATVSATTEYQDNSAANIRTFSIASVAAGDHVIVSGYPGASGIVATRVERRNASSQAQLKGLVSAATPTIALTIQGVAVDTSAASFRDVASNPMAAADFFTAITPGTTIVKVKWNAFTSTSAPVSEADIESVP
ncbi:MAG: DUF5666 domain-containing protein [Nitrospirota bacterium]